MNSRNPPLGAYLLLSVCELLCKLLCKLFFYVRLATFCMSDSQTSDSCMSEGPPIERWRNTCVAISSKLQEIFRPGYKKWPSDRNRNIYQEFLLPPLPSSSETTTKLLWIYRMASSKLLPPLCSFCRKYLLSFSASA